MTIHGRNFIAGQLADPTSQTFQAVDPATGKSLDPIFFEASEALVENAMRVNLAAAFVDYRKRPAGDAHASFSMKLPFRSRLLPIEPARSRARIGKPHLASNACVANGAGIDRPASHVR